MTSNPYDKLVAHTVDVALLQSSAALLSWDQETLMPPAGISHRARQLAQLARIGHEQAVRPEVGDWLQACEEDAGLSADPTSVMAVNVRELRRNYDRARKLPGSLVSEIAETTSLAQHEWAEARQASDFARFQPWLQKLLDLLLHKAECLGWAADGEPFDALLDDFEPGATASELQELFTPLRARLTELLGMVRDNGRPPSSRFWSATFPVAAQEELVRFVVERIGFDFRRGRMDHSTHPFSVGTHCDDVRITNRYRDDGLLDSLGSGMHEAGHGIYEQGLLPEHTGTPMGSAVSLGIHESQSRLWENQVGRSRAFWTWCHAELPRFLGATADYSLEDLFGAANLVRPDFIRVEADEATYNLHVMVRFDIELRMLRREIDLSDVPAEWNRLYRDYLALDVPDDRRGCLQDVHWSCGMFGYFPTYTLGNLYAAQLHQQALAEHPDLEEQFARGEFGALKSWLNRRVHAQGQRWRAKDLCREVCGSALSAAPFLSYLETKLRDVYELS